MLSSVARKHLSGAFSRPTSTGGPSFGNSNGSLQRPSSSVLLVSRHLKTNYFISSRSYVARDKKYMPKYKEMEQKEAIIPSRFLDPSKEKRMPATRRKDLAFDENELGTAIFEAFDMDMSTREIDPESMSTDDLEKLVRKQQEREDRIFAGPSSTDTSKSSKPTPPKRAVSPPSQKGPSVVPIVRKIAAETGETLDAEIEKVVEVPKEVQQRKALVAIVGRPNVGKSSLFNRLIRKSKSLITTTAGTTRDRKYGITKWEDYEMMFVDTGGMLGDDPWSESITEQAEVAISEADMIVMLTDFVDGVTEPDKQLAKRLRNSGKTVILAVNKCDNEARLESETLSNFNQLGLGNPYPVSASHGHGTAELLDAILEPLPRLGFQPKPVNEEEEVPTFPISKDRLVTSGAFNADGSRKDIRVALVGVPNVGKSSLLNQILGSRRSVVSDRPGTTTDPIDQHIRWKNEFPITIVDTAGVRKKKSQEGHVEKLSALWSLKVVESSHVSVLLLDAEAGAQAQDVRLSSYIIDNYRSCIVVVNKWDLAPDRSLVGMQAYEEQLRERLQFWYYVPVVFASAKTGFNVDSIMAWIVRVSDERRIHLATRKLFQIIEQASIIKMPPASGKKRVKFRFCTQVNLGGSPTFIFFANHPELIDAPYKRFLEGFVRQNYAFTGTPIRLMFRQNSATPMADREKRKANQRLRNGEVPKEKLGPSKRKLEIRKKRLEAAEEAKTALDVLAPRYK